jgi:hypothetical protein
MIDEVFSAPLRLSRNKSPGVYWGRKKGSQNYLGALEFITI